MAETRGHIFGGMVETTATPQDAFALLNWIHDEAHRRFRLRIALAESTLYPGGEGGVFRYVATSKYTQAMKLAEYKVIVVTMEEPHRVGVSFNLLESVASQDTLLGLIPLGKADVPGMRIAELYSTEMVNWAKSRSDDYVSSWRGGNA